MSVSISKLENYLSNTQKQSSFVDLLLKYLILKQKLEDTSNHSWYFKQSINSKQAELGHLGCQFENLREKYNNSSLDSLIQKINENNDYLSDAKTNYRGFNHRIVCSWKRNENDLYNEFIHLKNKIEKIKPIEDYIVFPEEFLKLVF